MTTVTYTAGCRDCLQAENQSINIPDYRPEDLLQDTEYNAMGAINFQRDENNIKCSFCGSTNVEPFDIKVGNQLIFEASSVANQAKNNDDFMLECELKKENGNIKFRAGGVGDHSNLFLKEGYNTILNRVRFNSKSTFNPKQNGYFYAAITSPKNITDRYDISFETMRYLGLSKGEVYDGIMEKATKYGVEMDDKLFK
ncbi:hypothetical protein [Fodinibius sp.]|uniref:hypothetical protein n=1 Tax=Fodinibius sp. TaxID=1872440 RepID=UPI002ACDF137|nr:hypothetical protein [Fodinibius sp.]MDZ7660069.1 hypothetical protein [Fodinibius sp.]